MLARVRQKAAGNAPISQIRTATQDTARSRPGEHSDGDAFRDHVGASVTECDFLRRSLVRL
jgi:hypothetical protein